MKIKIKLSRKAHGAQSSTAEIVASNDDLLTEILIRLPIKSLIRFELVSKRWQSIITSREFMLLRNPTLSPATGLLLRNLDFGYEPNPLFEYIPFSVKEPSNPPFRRLNFIESPPLTDSWHSCNGLLLCYSHWSLHVDRVKRVCVFNPCTKKYFSLPQFQGIGDKPWIRMRGMRLAFDPTLSPHYKVLLVWEKQIGEPSEFQFEVYSSETGRWRMCYGPFKGCTFFDNGVYWNGAINWLSFYTWEFLYYNLEDEVLAKMPMPPSPEGWDWTDRRRPDKVYFGESCDHLHYVGIFGPQIQFKVYEMKRDYSEWFLKYKVDLSHVVAANPGIIWHSYDPNHAYYYNYEIFTLIRGEKDEDSFFILQIPGKALRYNVVDKSFEVVYEFTGDGDQDYLKYEGCNGCQYIESLCPV